MQRNIRAENEENFKLGGSFLHGGLVVGVVCRFSEGVNFFRAHYAVKSWDGWIEYLNVISPA